MTTIWKIDSVVSHDEMFDKQDVIFAVNFSVVGENNVVRGTAAIAYNSNTIYKSIADITEADLLTWVKSSLSDDAKSDYENRASEKVPNVTIKVV